VKASFKAEAIGLNASQRKTARTFGVEREVRRQQRPWVAALTGLTPAGAFQRTFLRAKADFRDANSKGTRGVWFHWTLDPGLYEADYPVTWDRREHRLLRVTDDGHVHDVSEEEVRAWLENVTSA
jgi:hypothetical protein